MTQTVEAQPEQERWSQLLGLGLLGTAWRLLAAHWWQLVAIAACAYVAHDLVMRLALLAYRAGALPGLLVFSLVPLVPVVAIVLMLLVLRRRQGASGGFAAFVAAIGSVLIPFLVVYESQGDFSDDLSEFLYGGFTQVQEAQWGIDGVEPGAFDALVPDAGDPLLLAVVVVAFLLRALGARIAARDSLWQGSGARRGLRVTLRSLVGYAEIVWIVIGAVVVNTTVKGLHDWWQQRRLGRSLDDWWQSVTVSFPTFGDVGAWLATVVGTVLDGVVTGLVTPLAWLTIGVVIYGLSAAEGISEDEVVTAMQRQSRLKKVTQRVSPAVISLAWRRIADTEGHFGALLGGVAMILRSRFVPVLVFCLVYTAATTWLPYLLWDIPRSLLTRFDYVDWLALYGPMQAVSQILVLCVTAPLLAAFADALLTRFGAQSQLRLPQSISSSM
ncbi:hypothetical protein [Pseudactinotalea suaedae]|uniref:hypothetical protein n=1 Tax=Pseudactinotalea suaedae TaxID=1524924 RepID=UPI0012E31A11|nr:hypothetical protein [Pseudactinotalea suaedae]